MEVVGVMNRVLIFGVGGFVGTYLVKEFLESDYKVYGSDVHKTNILPKEIEFEEADILNADDVKKLVLSIEPNIIINLAAISSVGVSWNIPQTTMSVNVIGALNILEAARSCNIIPKVMFIGSSEEYAVTDGMISEKNQLDANNPYGISKMAQEKFVEVYRKHYGMMIYYVRPFNHTGIGQRASFVIPSFCKQVAEIEKTGRPGVIKVGNLSAKRDFSNVKDIVRAYRMIVENDDCTKIFNVGSGTAHSLNEILEYIISLSSQEIKVEVDPERVRPVDTPFICCDYGYIECELGWSPEYTIFDTVKEMYDFYLNNN